MKRWQVIDTWNGGTKIPRIRYVSEQVGISGNNECHQWILDNTPFSTHQALVYQGYQIVEVTQKYVGYHDDSKIPLKPGDMVTILKGTRIATTMPNQKNRAKVAGRTYKIKVDHILGGTGLPGCDTKFFYSPFSFTNPRIRWAGAGGYWFDVDINDVPEAK